MSQEINKQALEPAQNRMGTEPEGKLLFSMALPMTISMLFQALYNVVDSYFVAQLSQDAMNAVSLAFPMQSLLIAFSVGTGVGMSALISRSLGEKRPERAREIAGTGLFLFGVTAVFFCIIGLLFSRSFFTMQTDNAVIIRYGGDYLGVVMGICFFLYAQVAMERMLQSVGRTDKSMLIQLSGALINIILDPLFIFGYLGLPRLEVLGAAVATVIGQGILEDGLADLGEFLGGESGFVGVTGCHGDVTGLSNIRIESFYDGRRCRFHTFCNRSRHVNVLLSDS